MNTSANDGNNNDDFDNNPTNNNNDQHERKKKGKGRKKISIEKIENESNLQVTFSKRRAGVFKKASELSTLCGAETAVVVFSPGNKPHSFGHPSVESVANRFLNDSNNGGSMQNINAAEHLMMAHGEAAMQQRNRELVAIEPQLERERMRKKQLDEVARTNPSLDQLTYEQLEHLKNSVTRFKSEFEAKLKRNDGETSSWVNPRSQQDQGFGFPAPGYGYGAASIAPTAPGGSSSSAPFGYPFDNFGYNVQYPPAGPSALGFNYGYNGVDPAAVVPYDGTGRASGSGSGTSNMMGTTNEDPDNLRQGSPDHGTGFGGNYGHLF